MRLAVTEKIRSDGCKIIDKRQYRPSLPISQIISIRSALFVLGAGLALMTNINQFGVNSNKRSSKEGVGARNPTSEERAFSESRRNLLEAYEDMITNTNNDVDKTAIYKEGQTGGWEHVKSVNGHRKSRRKLQAQDDSRQNWYQPRNVFRHSSTPDELGWPNDDLLEVVSSKDSTGLEFPRRREPPKSYMLKKGNRKKGKRVSSSRPSTAIPFTEFPSFVLPQESIPSAIPSAIPSTIPSAIHSAIPSAAPHLPTPSPSISELPTEAPTKKPTLSPTHEIFRVSARPSVSPISIPIASTSGSKLFKLFSEEESIFEAKDTVVGSVVEATIGSSTSSSSEPSHMTSFESTAMPLAPFGSPSITSSDFLSDFPSAIPRNHPSESPPNQPAAIPSDTPWLYQNLTPSFGPSNKSTERSSDMPSSEPSEWPSLSPNPSVSSSKLTPIPSEAPILEDTPAPFEMYMFRESRRSSAWYRASERSNET